MMKAIDFFLYIPQHTCTYTEEHDSRVLPFIFNSDGKNTVPCDEVFFKYVCLGI